MPLCRTGAPPGSERDRVADTEAETARSAMSRPERTCPSCGAIVRRSVCTRCGTRLDPVPESDPGRPQIPGVQRQLETAAGLTLSHAAAQWGLALLTADRPEEALNAFTAALASEPASAERPNLLLLQAYARDLCGRPDQALQGYLEAIRNDGSLIADAATRLHALLTTRTADLFGPWITSQWAESVRTALSGGPDSSHELAQLAVLVAHVQALRGEHSAAVESLQAAMTASVEDVAMFAADLPRWAAAALEDPATASRMHILLAEVDFLLHHYASALTHTDDALTGGLTDENDPYGDARAYELRGQALWQLGRTEDAVASLLDAGRRYTWQANWPRARSVLHELTAVDPSCQEAWWLTSNALANSAVLQAAGEPAAADATGLRDAVSAWERGYALGPPATAEDSWPYFLIAWFYDCLAATSTRDNSGYHWRAALYIERGLVLNQDHTAQVELMWQYRSIRNVCTSWQVLEECEHEITPDHRSYPNLLLEKAIAQIGFGHYKESLDLLNDIDAIETTDKNTFSPGLVPLVRGIALAMSGELPAAREQLEQSLKESRSISILSNLADCCRVQGDTDAEQRYCHEILAGTASGSRSASGNQDDRASALFYLGRYQEALELLYTLTGSPWDTAGDRAWRDAYVGLCLRALGRPEASDALQRSAAGISSAHSAAAIEAELRILEGTGQGSFPGQTRYAAIFGQRARDIAVQPKGIKEAETELRRAMAVPDAPAVIRVAGLAAIGRMRLAVSDTVGAAGAYEALLAEESLFPEAASRYVQAASEQVMSLLRADELAAAVEAVQPAMDRLLVLAQNRPATASRPDVAELAALACVARLRKGDYPASMHWLTVAVPEDSASDDGGAARRAGEAWRRSLGSPGAYWQLADHLASCREQASGRLAQALDVISVECRRYLEERLGLAQASDEAKAPVVDPVVVSLGQGLVVDDLLEKVQLGVGEIRTRIQTAFGLTVPGVKFRDDSSLLADAFTIALDGTARLEGRVSTVPPAAAGEKDPDPGRSPDHGHGPLAQVFSSLESLFLVNLPLFLGTQEIDWLVRAWVREHGDDALLGAALPDDEAWLRLGVLARALATAQVPLRWGEILAEIAKSSPGPMDMEMLTAKLTARLSGPGAPASAAVTATEGLPETASGTVMGGNQ